MSDRREQLEAALRLLDLEEALTKAKDKFRESRSVKSRDAYKSARDALQSERTAQRVAEGRREGTGAASVGSDD